ncbi:PaaX family transcriptional regulator [Nocardia sp. NBC_00416]|uniref:PaaX family transcriptional regulator n=1 Tax=Nocardia sp. NBC_00416 TaxID=2975991 RepID=UPI002E1FB837
MVESVRVLPRAQQGAQPQRLLTTLLGDYWFHRAEHLPSGALVRLLEEFGITAPSARAAVRRVAERGLLATSRHGRATAYGLPPHGQEVIVGHMRRLFAFGARAPEWDGKWTVVAFSVPEGDRDARRALRDGLRRLQFGTLFDAVWFSPHNRSDAVLALADSLGLASVTVLRGEELSRGLIEDVVPGSFELDVLDAGYRGFLTAYLPCWQAMAVSTVSPAQALRLRTEIVTDWRVFPTLDPNLPAELLPSDWPRAAARALVVDVYNSLGARAELRFREIVAQFDPGLAALADHHLFAESAIG